MLKDKITVRSSDEGFRVTAEYLPTGGGGVYHFDGHVDRYASMEDALGRIRRTLEEVKALADRRGTEMPIG